MDEQYQDHDIPLGYFNQGYEENVNELSMGIQTNDFLDCLPSRQLEKSLGTTLKRKSTRKEIFRDRRSIYRTIHMRRNADAAEVISSLTAFQDPNTDGYMEPEVNQLFKEIPVSLMEKRKALHTMTSPRKRKVSWLTRQQYNFRMGWQHFKYRISELTYYTELWKSHLKTIEGHFGTGVKSYFLFLKWLFLLNIPLFLLTFTFQILPQLLFRLYQSKPSGYQNNTSFDGTELLTGKGWFHETEMYYGFYTNQTLSIWSGTEYSMPYAYLFTNGCFYLLCLFIVAFSIAKSYKTNYIEANNEFDFYYASKIFCSWDFGITSKDASDLRHKSIENELQEYLSVFMQKVKKTTKQQCRLFFWRVFMNLLVLGLIILSGYAVFMISLKLQHLTNLPVLQDLALPLCISAVNFIMPFGFHFIATKEDYEKPKWELYMTMFRTMLLKAANIAVLCYYWIENIISSEIQCWETYISQEIYRLVLVDFFFILVFTFFSEFVLKKLHLYCSKKFPLPEFNIATNTLDLVYSQGLCWLGTFYCPMMPLLMIIKLFVIFYVKRISVIQNCRPSSKSWRAAKTHTIFLGFLFLFFLLSSATVACSIVLNEPSKACGPFRGNPTVYYSVIFLIEHWEGKLKWLQVTIKVITSPGCIAGFFVTLCVSVYYMHIYLDGYLEMVNLLKHQLIMEGRDKAFLLKLLQQVRSKGNNQAEVHDDNDSPNKNI